MHLSIQNLFLSVEIVAILSLTLTSVSAEEQYCYNATCGPATWSGICQTGNRQSPINLNAGAATSCTSTALTFKSYHVPATSFNLKNLGHTIQVTPSTINPPRSVVLQPIKGEFILDVMHLHWASDNTKGCEHGLNGQTYCAELHCVHHNSIYGSLEEALGSGKDSAVLGIAYLIQCGQTSTHPQLDQIFSRLNLVSDGPKDVQVTSANLYLFDLVNSMKTTSGQVNFYSYKGSLTTPGCQEVVTWVLFDKPLQCTNADVMELCHMIPGAA